MHHAVHVLIDVTSHRSHVEPGKVLLYVSRRLYLIGRCIYVYFCLQAFDGAAKKHDSPKYGHVLGHEDVPSAVS